MPQRRSSPDSKTENFEEICVRALKCTKWKLVSMNRRCGKSDPVRVVVTNLIWDAY